MASPVDFSDKGIAVATAATVQALVSTAAAREAIQILTREKKWIDEQHVALCRIPAPTFFEQRRAEWMAAQFQEAGCETRIDRAGNVVAFPVREHDGPLIALTAHLDTVLSPRTPDEIRVSPEGVFEGPGVSDNGAGLAALLAMTRVFRSSPALANRAAGLVLAANVGEEGEGNLSGMRYLCRNSGLGSRVRAWIVLDGPDTSHITCQALGSRRFEVTFTGPGGHSWSDFGVPNPVQALSRALTMFADNRPNGGPRYSFNVGTIEGGVGINSIPTEASAKLDLRAETPGRIDDLVEALNAAVEKATETENRQAATGRLAARIREVGSRPAGSLPSDSPLLTCLRLVDAHLAIRSHLDCASTDANIPLSLGLPALSLGAGGQGGGAHSRNEWFRPAGRPLGLSRIFLLLCLLLDDLALQ